MAMRPALRIGGAASPSHTRAAVQPVYENFRPQSEWQEDEESNVLLLIFLPGFHKQHLKVSTEGRNIVRVQGERLDAGNKWSRFRADYQVPEDYNMRGIHAKFEGGILTITMPRKKESTKPVPEARVIPSQQRVSQEDLTSKIRTSPDIERRPGSSTASAPSISEEERKFHETSLESRPDKKMSSTQPQVTKEDSTQPQLTKKDVDEEQRETKTTLLTGANDVKEIRKTERADDRKSSEKVDKLADDQVENIEELKSQKHKGNGDTGKKGKHIEPDEKQPRKDAASGSVDQSGIGNHKKSVKSLMELNEERQLLANVGVAVLVIVALGAYVSYTFGSEAAK